ncbi:MAG: adenine phosphoribosyltransferase [Verrucomicrobiota bacterium]
MNKVLKSATERLKASVRDVPDFPEKGIIFKDITPILQNSQLFRLAITVFNEHYQRKTIDTIVAIDARGFLFASALAYCLGTGVALVRKKGKLPYQTIEQSYSLEYGENTLAMHTDAIQKDQKVLIVDDVLATGGTVGATAELVKQLGGNIVEIAVFIELEFLKGREKLAPLPVFSVLKY